MLGPAVALQPAQSVEQEVAIPSGFLWDTTRFPLTIRRRGTRYFSQAAPRDLVNPLIWLGPALHVDGNVGDDANSGLGSVDGDFANAKRSIHAAFVAGNATGGAYRVLIRAGQYEESAFTRNGNEEPDQPVALIGWDGPVRYRTGPFSVPWVDAGGTSTASISSVRRAFRTDVVTAQGHYSELQQVADPAVCAATPDSWAQDGGSVHVNTGTTPGSQDIALIRSFHGARFLDHDADIYLENIHTEGGITGALHFDAVAARNIVGVNCSFRYSAPSNPSAPLDAARIRRTDGLVAFFGCDASHGAKDGWSFHEDGTGGMHVLLQDCTGFRNGGFGAASCNAFTTHDSVRSVVLNGDFGLSRNGTEVHCVQSTHTWIAGTRSVARDIDGSSTAYKCSNPSFLWLQDCIADADGAAQNYAIEANAGTVFARDLVVLSGLIDVSLGGSVSGF